MELVSPTIASDWIFNTNDWSDDCNVTTTSWASVIGSTGAFSTNNLDVDSPLTRDTVSNASPNIDAADSLMLIFCTDLSGCKKSYISTTGDVSNIWSDSDSPNRVNSAGSTVITGRVCVSSEVANLVACDVTSTSTCSIRSTILRRPSSVMPDWISTLWASAL